MKTENNKNEISIIILILLISLASVGASIILPSLPEVASSFFIPVNKVQLVITSFVFGYAISQILYGPISNSFGRKKAIIAGLSISTLGSLLCVISYNFEFLIIGRIIMAIGAGCGLNMTFTLINDCFRDSKARQITAYTSCAFAIVPGIALYIGGELTEHLNWRYCFVFQLIYNLVLLILIKTMPETLNKSSRLKFDLNNIFLQYKNVFQNSKIYLHILIAGMTTSIIYVIYSSSPIISSTNFHMSPISYSHHGIFITISYFIGNIITGKLTKYLHHITLYVLGACIVTIGAFILIYFSAYKPTNPIMFFLATSIIFLGLPLIFTTTTSEIMTIAVDKSTTSSIFSFGFMLITFGSTILMSTLKYNLVITLPALIIVMVIIINTLIFWQYLKLKA